MAGIVCRRSLRGEDGCRDVEMEEYLSGNEEADPVGFPLYVTAHYSAAVALQIKDLPPPQPSLGDVWMQFWGKDTISV